MKTFEITYSCDGEDEIRSQCFSANTPEDAIRQFDALIAGATILQVEEVSVREHR